MAPDLSQNGYRRNVPNVRPGRFAEPSSSDSGMARRQSSDAADGHNISSRLHGTSFCIQGEPVFYYGRAVDTQELDGEGLCDKVHVLQLADVMGDQCFTCLGCYDVLSGQDGCDAELFCCADCGLVLCLSCAPLLWQNMVMAF